MRQNGIASAAVFEDLRVLRPLYREAETVVDALDLTPEGVRYYANAALKSRIFQVSRRADDDRHLHLACFITHQFLRLHDVLIDILLLSVQSTLERVRAGAQGTLLVVAHKQERVGPQTRQKPDQIIGQ
jgi:hypothetical protein